MKIKALAIPKQESSLAFIKKSNGDRGEGIITNALNLLIANLCDGLNVGKNMNGPQVEEASRLVYKDYYHWSIDHFMMAFDRFKAGRYQHIKIYDRFDVLIIFEILEAFGSELRNERRKIDEEAKRLEELSWEEKAVPMPVEVKEALNEMNHKALKGKYDRQAKPITDEQKLVNRWINDFKNHKNKIKVFGKEFVDIKGRKYDCEEYCNLRLKHYQHHHDKIS